MAADNLAKEMRALMQSIHSNKGEHRRLGQAYITAQDKLRDLGRSLEQEILLTSYAMRDPADGGRSS